MAAAPGAALARNPLRLPDTQYEPAAWAQVEGWADDDHAAAFATFLKSCKVILKSSPAQHQRRPMFGALHHVCQKAMVADLHRPGEARAFFEKNFRPVRIAPLSSPDRDGFVTGYYEPIVEGAREQGDGYDYPFYRKPASLLPGGRMAVAGAPVVVEGKKKKKHAPRRKLVSFYDRTAIEDGALAGRNLEICWLKDPIDNFFAQIQGSVRVKLDDGSVMRLNYAAANGQPYYAVGRWLIDKGIIDKDDMSMDRIREWMMHHPDEAKDLRRRNRSYVFFHEIRLPSDQEPVGAQGVSLTPGRSIAVDHRLHVYGTPFFISGYLPLRGLKPDTWFQRTMIAQDTGGAIVGPARADLYFGAGAEAESVAGRMRHNAKFVMLVPRELMPSAEDDIPLPRPRPALLMSDNSAVERAGVSTQASAEPVKTPALAKPVVGLVSPVTKAATTTPEKRAERSDNKVQPVLPAAEKKTKTNKTKTGKKQKDAAVAAKPSSNEKAWEARVMPVIPPQTDAPAKTRKSKTHKAKTHKAKIRG